MAIRGSGVDPQGTVFDHAGRIFRTIDHTAAVFFETALRSVSIRGLQQSGALIECRHASPSDAGLDEECVVLEHPRIWPISYPSEWSAGMLFDAAHLTLDIATELASQGMTLHDAHPWNVLFRDGQPILVDLTSIAPASPNLAWPAHSQFVSHFRNPLRLHRAGLGALAALGLRDPIRGVDSGFLRGCLGWRTWTMFPVEALSHSIGGWLQRNEAAREWARAQARRARISEHGRLRFLERERRLIARLRPRARTDTWTGYVGEISREVDRSEKQAAVSRMLSSLRPATVLDLGCNTGEFSVMAARLGSRVVAVDSSAPCIENLYAIARRDRLQITPLVVPLESPSGGLGFFDRQFQPLHARVRAEVAMCLGLVHHLHISLRQGFGNIADSLASVCSRHCILEYVGHDDANVARLTSLPVPPYSLDSFLGSLSRRFAVDAVMPSDRDSRRLVLLRRI